MITNRWSSYYDQFCDYMERDTKGVEVSVYRKITVLQQNHFCFWLNVKVKNEKKDWEIIIDKKLEVAFLRWT